MAANVKVTQRIVGARSRADTAVGSRPKLNTVSTRAVDRKSTRLNSSHSQISYAVFCLKKKKEYLTRSGYVMGARQRAPLATYKPRFAVARDEEAGRESHCPDSRVRLWVHHPCVLAFAG